MKTKPKSHKIKIITLGCSKNVVDSEVLLKQLDVNQLQILHESDESRADTVIINTCGFIQDAKEESIETILEYAKDKEKGNLQNLYVIGCLSERYRDDLRKEIPEVDQYFGVYNIEEILDSLGLNYQKERVGERVLTTPDHYAYLKISEGCDRKCAFCAIPIIKGPHRSRSIESLVHETELLAKKGVKEIMIIAQDLSYYGLDLYKEQKLNELLHELVKIEAIEWIRLHYAYPANFPHEILPLIKENEKICNYLDIPIQHINDQVLKLMRRGSSKAQIMQLLSMIRKEVPHIALRTTLLTGHPGETPEAFQELAQWVYDMKFERLGVFAYSHEEDTYGFKQFTDVIPESVKLERKDKIMSIQQDISNNMNKSKIGDLLKVIIDRVEGDYFVGRTEQDSPEIDNEVLIKKEGVELKTGEFCRVKITGAEAFDLYGDAVVSGEW